MKKHAFYSPSAASRWVNCPASLHVVAAAEQSTSLASAEGTAAHELLETSLRQARHPSEFAGRVFNTSCEWTDHADRARRGFVADAEMIDAVSMCFDEVFRIVNTPAKEFMLGVEQKVFCPTIHEDCWGTCDIVLYQPYTRNLHIIDYKHGRGVYVAAHGNWQLTCYAIGAAWDIVFFGGDPPLTIDLSICQPRHEKTPKPFDTWSIGADELAMLGERLREAANDKTTLAAGAWCRWCSHKPNCSAYCAAQETSHLPDLTQQPTEY